jgi:predicted permease
MTEVFLKLSPIVLTYALGIVLRRAGVFRKNDAEIMLKLVFYVALPALIVLSVSRVEITPRLAAIPVVGAVIVVSTLGLAHIVGRGFALERKTFGVTIIGSMIMNTSFIFPFVLVAYGEEGFAEAVIFDVGNALLVMTLVYYLACRYGDEESGSRGALRRVASSPPLWALAAGLALNAADVTIDSRITSFLTLTGSMLIPLVMLALGVHFSPRIARWPLVVAVLATRSGGGLAVALLLSWILGLEGLSRAVVLVCGAAPVGFNTLVFASMTGLDVDLAAELLSISILLGVIFVPILMMVLQ